MNTLKTTMSKIAQIEQPKVELAKHEVNLALLEDLAMAVKGARGVAAGYAKSKALIEKNVTAMKKAVDDLKTNKDWGKKALASAQKFKGQFDKLAKELGVNLSGSEADKLISEYFMLAEDGQGDIDDALAILNTIK